MKYDDMVKGDEVTTLNDFAIIDGVQEVYTNGPNPTKVLIQKNSSMKEFHMTEESTYMMMGTYIDDFWKVTILDDEPAKKFAPVKELTPGTRCTVTLPTEDVPMRFSDMYLNTFFRGIDLRSTSTILIPVQSIISIEVKPHGEEDSSSKNSSDS